MTERKTTKRPRTEPPPRRPSEPWLDPTTFDALFLARVIDSVAHPIFVKDREFRFVLLNRAFADLIGRPRAEMLGKTDYDLFAKSEADFFREKDEETFREQRETVIEEEHVTDAHGKTHILSTTKVPFREDGGTATHLIGIIHDITELKSAGEELRRTKEELERRVEERSRELRMAQDNLVRKERLAVLGRLAGGVAHQIRNPLGAIKNAAYVVARGIRAAEGTGHGEDAAQALAIIHDEVERANRIITGLLEYARVRAPTPSPVDLEELVRSTVFAVSVPDHIRVRLDLTAVPLVAVDAEQLRSALENLLLNGLEAMSDGGTLTIKLFVRPPYAVLRIEDTGGGFLPQAKERLFEPLVTTKARGLGLGLVTARTLVEGQGGEVHCVRADPPGAVFEVLLPLGVA